MSLPSFPIGSARSMTVSSTTNSLEFRTQKPSTTGGWEDDSSFILFPGVVQNFNSVFQEVDKLSHDLRSQKLTEAREFDIGRGFKISLCPGYKCVGIRRFFSPPDNPDKVIPTKYGVGLKFAEWDELVRRWDKLLSVIKFPSQTSASLDQEE